MGQVYDKLLGCYESIKGRVPFEPKVALVLGSGLGDYGDTLEIEAAIDYHEIRNFPVSTTPGHKGRFLFAHIEGVPAVVMQGRVHYHEGYSITDVVLPVRLMKLMGAKILFLTNAAGSVNLDFKAGSFMMLTDHISSLMPSPLQPEHIPLGPVFPDMHEVYDRELRDKIRQAADTLQIPLNEGVYLQLSGPAYETPAEVRMCRVLGADAVGMSTAVEAQAANHMGMKICGISFISNLGCGISDRPLSHEEVKEAADIAAPQFKKLVTESIRLMGRL